MEHDQGQPMWHGRASNGFIARTLSRAWSWETLLFYCRQVEGSIRDCAARESVEIRLLGAEDVLPWADSLSMTSTQITHSFAVGDLYFGAFHAGQLVHVTWLIRKTAWLPDLPASFALGHEEAYLANSFTAPEHRGRGIQPAVMQAVLRHELSLGIRRHFAYVRKRNYAAAQNIRKHGNAIRVWTIFAAQLAGSRRRWISGLDQPGLPKMDMPEGFAIRRVGRFGLWLARLPEQRFSWTIVPPNYGS